MPLHAARVRKTIAENARSIQVDLLSRRSHKIVLRQRISYFEYHIVIVRTMNVIFVMDFNVALNLVLDKASDLSFNTLNDYHIKSAVWLTRIMDIC